MALILQGKIVLQPEELYHLKKNQEAVAEKEKEKEICGPSSFMEMLRNVTVATLVLHCGVRVRTCFTEDTNLVILVL